MMSCQGVTATTVTADNGESTIVVTNTDQPEETTEAVYAWGNQIREKEGDNDLNIIMDGESPSDAILYHYTYNSGESEYRSWGIYYYDEIRGNVWMLEDSSDGPEPLSWAITKPTKFFAGPFVDWFIDFLGNKLPWPIDKLFGDLSPSGDMMRKASKPWGPDNPQWTPGWQLHFSP
jgi:hypothetical protein